jgi:hypothetical protein
LSNDRVSPEPGRHENGGTQCLAVTPTPWGRRLLIRPAATAQQYLRCIADGNNLILVDDFI